MQNESSRERPAKEHQLGQNPLPPNSAGSRDILPKLSSGTQHAAYGFRQSRPGSGLADAVEAASRTLADPTAARIQGLVQKIVNRIFSDGQLDECELTLKDLHNIAKSFNKILYGIHHHRIEYSESRATGNENDKGKLKNGSASRQQARQSQDLKEEDSPDGERHLKRLGLS
mgnify:CR=1 FL=1